VSEVSSNDEQALEAVDKVVAQFLADLDCPQKASTVRPTPAPDGKCADLVDAR
jgi:hypothetical protein